MSVRRMFMQGKGAGSGFVAALPMRSNPIVPVRRREYDGGQRSSSLPFLTRTSAAVARLIDLPLRVQGVEAVAANTVGQVRSRIVLSLYHETWIEVRNGLRGNLIG
jgi:hypothetical protein